jgi:GNAT superfamily N-acetyltransferase
MQRERRILRFNTTTAELLAQPEEASPAGVLIRPPATGDAEGLARLMLDAYRGSVDDAGETLDDARAEIGKLTGGAYGRFDPDASEVAIHEGAPVAATLLTHYEGAPMLAFSLTLPAWRRRGLARGGILRAVRRLREAGYESLSLAVTAGNDPAMRLYESLGFVRV